MCVREIELEFGVLVFEEGGKLEKNSRSKDENQQQTEPTYETPGPGIEPGPHCWEAGALTCLTTAPSLLLQYEFELIFELIFFRVCTYFNSVILINVFP